MKEEKFSLDLLRAALREEPGAPSLDAAAAPFIARYFEELLRTCDRLVEGSKRKLGLAGGDLAVDAWMAVQKRLADDTAGAIVDEEHFRKLLYRIAKTRFLDALEKETNRDEVELDGAYAVREGDLSRGGMGNFGDQLQAQDRAEGNLLFGERGRFLPLVEAAFQGDEALRALASQPPRRRAKQFQALVLFLLAEHFRNEIGTTYGELAILFRECLGLLSIPQETWEPVENIALDESAGDVELFAIVNRVCETNLKDRATLSVLRYELTQLAR